MYVVFSRYAVMYLYARQAHEFNLVCCFAFERFERLVMSFVLGGVRHFVNMDLV